LSSNNQKSHGISVFLIGDTIIQARTKLSADAIFEAVIAGA